MTLALKKAQAGTLESSDVMITVAPVEAGSGIVVELESIVMAQYGGAIRKVMEDVLHAYSVKDVYVKAVDRGALDCTIQARMKTALERAGVPGKEAVQ